MTDAASEEVADDAGADANEGHLLARGVGHHTPVGNATE